MFTLNCKGYGQDCLIIGICRGIRGLCVAEIECFLYYLLDQMEGYELLCSLPSMWGIQSSFLHLEHGQSHMFGRQGKKALRLFSNDQTTSPFFFFKDKAQRNLSRAHSHLHSHFPPLSFLVPPFHYAIRRQASNSKTHPKLT